MPCVGLLLSGVDDHHVGIRSPRAKYASNVHATMLMPGMQRQIRVTMPMAAPKYTV